MFKIEYFGKKKFAIELGPRLSEMVRQGDWAALAAKLTRLEVVFPAAHTPNAYRYGS